jgi:hypothetical protein
VQSGRLAFPLIRRRGNIEVLTAEVFKSMSKNNGHDPASDGVRIDSATAAKKPRAPGSGRRPGRPLSALSAFKRGTDLIAGNYEVIASEMLAKATGAPTALICPRCKHKFEARVNGSGDTDLLKHLDNRVSGKPVIRADVDMTAKVDLSGAQLVAMSVQVQQHMATVRQHDIAALADSVRLLPDRVEGGEGGSI